MHLSTWRLRPLEWVPFECTKATRTFALFLDDGDVVHAVSGGVFGLGFDGHRISYGVYCTANGRATKWGQIKASTTALSLSRGSNLQVHMGRDVRLRVSIIVGLEDPVVKIQHIVHLEALLLTFPEGMPLPGVRREAGAAVKSFIQCIPKVGS